MGCPLKRGGLYSRLYVGAVLLAAGCAQRMGGQPKPLLQLGGVTLVRRALIALSGAGVDELVVVTGHHAAEVESEVRDFAVTVAHNPDYAQRGQATSVRTGLAALSMHVDAIVVALADQPLINAADLTALIGAYKRSPSGQVVIPRVGGQRGNPIVMNATVRQAILDGGVDVGCRKWIAAHEDQVNWFDSDNRHYVVDLDTPDDLNRFRQEFGHALCWPMEKELQT